MNDPVKGCDVYKNIGCAHVDGFLCDYPNCSILKDYRMNERIKELAGQAREYVEDAIELGFPKDQVDDIRDEKFAALIVQDCADFVRVNYDHEDAELIAWNMEIKYGLHGDYA